MHAFPYRRIRLACLALAGALASLPGAPAVADDSLLYVGAGAGQSNVKVGQIDFNKTDFGWKAYVGTRPISLLGAELAYLDFGKPTRTVNGVNNDASAKGVSATGLVYLPLPMPLVDVYGKAGFARLQATARAYAALCGTTGPGCSSFAFDRKNTQATYGLGAQLHWGSLAARLEYEHFQTNGGTPSLLSVGVFYGFL